jgi:hypothetical protein
MAGSPLSPVFFNACCLAALALARGIAPVATERRSCQHGAYAQVCRRDQAHACRPLRLNAPLTVQSGDNLTLQCNEREPAFPAPMAVWSLETGATLTMRNCRWRIAGPDVGLGVRERAALDTAGLTGNPYRASTGVTLDAINTTAQFPCSVRRNPNLNMPHCSTTVRPGLNAEHTASAPSALRRNLATLHTPALLDPSAMKTPSVISGEDELRHEDSPEERRACTDRVWSGYASSQTLMW